MWQKPTKEGEIADSPEHPKVGPYHESPKGISMPDMSPIKGEKFKGTTGEGHPVQSPHNAGHLTLKDENVTTGPTHHNTDGRSDVPIPKVKGKYYS